MIIIKKEGVNEKGFIRMFDAAVIVRENDSVTAAFLPAEKEKNFKRYATPEEAVAYANWILDVTPHGYDPEARRMAHRIIAAAQN